MVLELYTADSHFTTRAPKIQVSRIYHKIHTDVTGAQRTSSNAPNLMLLTSRENSETHGNQQLELGGERGSAIEGSLLW